MESYILLLFLLIGSAVGRVCTPPWKFSYENSCYYMGHIERLSWSESRIECIENGGHLVSFETKEEEHFINNYTYAHYKYVYYWIGLTDFGTEGKWHWDHSGRTASYTNWGPHEPNGRYHENCAHKQPFNRDYKWNDLSCDTTTPYMCEMS